MKLTKVKYILAKIFKNFIRLLSSIYQFVCKVRLSFVCKVKEQYHITLLQLKNGQSVLSTNFRENIRQYNSALSFV